MNAEQIAAWMPAILAVISLIGTAVTAFFTYKATAVSKAASETAQAAKAETAQLRQASDSHPDAGRQ